MDGGLENTWLIDSGCSYLMIGVAIWFSKLTYLLSCVWFLWVLACGFSVCLTCVDGHSFSHSMNTHEPFIRFDGFLDSFSWGMVWARGHVSRDSFVGPRPCLCDACFGSSYDWSLESLSPVCSNSHSLFSSSLYLTSCFLGGLNDFFYEPNFVSC
jgi:hypothetical protein